MADPTGLFESFPPRSIEQLEAWCDEHGIQRSAGLKVKATADGWSVYARRSFEMGQMLCQVPKTALLSTRTSSLPRLLPDENLAPKTSHTILYLALSLLHELRLGAASPFWGYIQSLPRETILLPVFWGIEELAGEDGRKAKDIIGSTEVQRDIFRKDSEGLSLDDVQSFYTTLAPHMPSTPTHPTPSPFLAYLHAYSLVCTRAFLIDLYHTVALCPFADLFNHSSEAHTSLSADDFVCHQCGSLAECSHDIPSTSGVVRRLEHLDDEERCRVAVGRDTVDLRVDRRTVDRGEEVLNSYGENLGDGRLLTEWGFLEEDSTGGSISFNLEELAEGGQRWVNMSARGWEVSLGKAGQDDDDLLLFIPPDEKPWSLDLDAEGTLSVNVWVLAYLGIQDYTEAGDEAMTKRSIAELLNAWTQIGEDDCEGPVRITAEVYGAVERVMALFAARLAALYGAKGTIEQLFEQREALGDDERLQEMALTVVINERRLLESTKEKWAELLTLCAPASASQA